MEPLSLKSALETLKKMSALKKEASDVEFKEVILELRNQLLEAQEQALSLREDNLALKQKLAQRGNSENLTEGKLEVQGFYYDSVDGKPVGLPYCNLCLEKENKLYRAANRNKYYSKCDNCNTTHNAGPNGKVNENEPPRSLKPVRKSRDLW